MLIFQRMARHKGSLELLSGVIQYFEQDAIFPAILRPFSGMNFPVSDEGSPLPEGLPTLTTLKWPFTSVDSVVLNKHMFVTKGFSTLTAHIWLFTIVNSLVCNKIRTLAEELPTCNALIRPCPSMNTPVFNESVFVTKVFPTFAALIRSLSSVNSLVLSKPVFTTESFPTFTALILPLHTRKGLHTHSVLLWCELKLDKATDTREILPSLLACGRHRGCIDYVALHKSLIHICSKHVLSIVLVKLHS